MTLLRDQAKEEIESHSRELDEAKQQHAEAQQLLQVARDEIAALQGALQAAAAGSSEEVERTLEAARQAESTAQQMRLETQVVSQQAAAEVAALVSELGSVEAALTQECQEGRASLSALSMQVQEKILQPLMVHWHRVKERTELTQSDLVEQDAAAAIDPGLQAAQAAALEGAQSNGQRLPTLLAVTVLTSWDEQRLQRELAISQDIAERVSALAQLSATAGIGGCVCSPLEVAALRAQHPEPFALVTPGIRPKGVAVGDQARVMTPPEAIAAGASQLVIGRPITQAEDPSGAFAQSCASLEL